MVADVSLQNLIPMPSRWGMATKAIRVPAQFLEDIYAMIEDKVAQLKIAIGADTPAEQTEEEWVNEILGLPADYQKGDPLPSEIQQEVDRAKTQAQSEVTLVSANPAAREYFEKMQNSQQQQPVEIQQTADRRDWTKEPPQFTREWIEFRESGPNGWNWKQKYLPNLLEEARNGDASAKAELKAFKANGVDISESVVVEPSAVDPSTVASKKQQANVEKRQAKRDRREAKAADKKKRETYYKVRAKAIEYEAEDREEFNNFLQYIQETCTPGKLVQYQEFLLKWNFQSLALVIPSVEKFVEDGQWMVEYYALRRAFIKEVIKAYPPSKTGGSNNDTFRVICIQMVNGWERAVNTIYVQENKEEINALCNGWDGVGDFRDFHPV